MDRFPDTSWDPDRPDVATLLAGARVRDTGQIAEASNYVFLLALEDDEAGLGYAVYKPLRGESPLWDFPPALYKREVASYLVSQALGWGLIPPTVARADGLEHGVGSLQLYIAVDHRCTYFDLRDAHAETMQRIATFDWLTNNADRKGGHVVLDARGRVWGIDNALTFHTEEKLRTVIWDYAGEAVPEALLADVGALVARLQGDSELQRDLGQFLDPSELAMLERRGQAILDTRRLPHPPQGRRPYPWPLI